MQITWLGHASFKIKANKQVIYLDPYSGEYDEKADIILISHGHYDHMSINIINKIRSDDTIILSTKEVVAEVNATTMSLGDKKRIKGIEIEAVAAYNIGRGFHHKDSSLGFIIDFNNKKIYFAGDTDLIPDIGNIKADIVLLPIGGIYTMGVRDAVEA